MPTKPSLLHKYLQNAELTFQIGTGVITYDVNGSPIEATTPLLVYAYFDLAQDRFNRSTAFRSPGLDENGLLLSGRLTDPSVLDLSKIDRTQPIECLLEKQLGRFLPNYDLDKPALYRTGYLSKVGQKITGYFYAN
jgi:hypothetical protein